jgi:hypothetical protein
MRRRLAVAGEKPSQPETDRRTQRQTLVSLRRPVVGGGKPS